MRRFLGWMMVVALPAVLVSVATSVGGPAAEWVSTGGPVGGLGYDVRMSPVTTGTMYVTDNNAGVARSLDAGRTWKVSNAGITVRAGPTGDAVAIFSLTVDPNDPNIVWAGTTGDPSSYGVFKSLDGGATWTAKNTGITSGPYGIVFRGFTVRPGSSSVVYAQAELPTDPVTGHGREFNRVQGVVYQTTDGGDHWSPIWSGENLARYVVVDPTDAATLYLSTGIFDREANNSSCATGLPGAGGVGVLKSTNGGSTWSTNNVGLADLYVGALRMHPTNRLVLFAATGNNACSGAYDGHIVSGLFRTVDGGATWTQVIAGDIMTTVAFSPSSPAVVYAGSAAAFYRSDDGGDTWSRLAGTAGAPWGPAGVRAGVPIDVVIDPTNPDLLYANNYGGGVFRSTDGARTWAVWSQGYSGADVHAAVIPDTATDTLLAIGRSGPFRSPNHGVDWVGIGNGAAGFAEWADVAVQPGNPQTILLSDEHQGVIVRSTNGGADFAEVLRNPGALASDTTRREGFKALAFAPSNGSIVYAGLAKDRGTIDASAPIGSVFYRSSNGGATFTAPTADLDGLNVYRLLVDRLDANTVWAATSGGLYKTTSGGTSWSQVASLGNRVIAAVAIDPASAGNIVASEKNGGIWISSDGGSTWPGGPFNTGFASSPPAVLALLFDPDPGAVGTVYAADFYSGVYRSTDGGRTWSRFPDDALTGLSIRAVKDLAIAGDAAHRVLYATTQGGGVFRMGGPAVIPSPPQAAFANVIVGMSSQPATFVVHNTGTAARSITSKSVGGAQAGDFAIQNDGCAGALPGRSSCTFDLVFSPTAAGARAATATIASDDPFRASASVALTGTAAPGVSISAGIASTPPRGGGTFAAQGGSATGFAWSLTTNGSGGSIGATNGIYVAGPNGSATDVIRVADSLGNAATQTVTVTAGVSIAPATASLTTGAAQTFTASGGSGAGFSWSLASNASGGSIGAGTGSYTAGPTGGVSDLVRVQDSLGNLASASVTVSAPAAAPPKGKSGGCGSTGVDGGLLSLLGLLVAIRRRRAWSLEPVRRGARPSR